MKKYPLTLLILFSCLWFIGCIGQPIQPYVTEPRAFVEGKIVVPPGKDPLGVKIQVAGKDASVKIFENPYFAYADENGNFKMELRNGGRYQLFARGRDFNINFGWVDALLEKKVTPKDIILTEKVMGEALFMVSLVDFEKVGTPELVIKKPTLGSTTFALFDDGTNGDVVPGDKVWTRLLNGLTSGRIEYLLKVDGQEVKDPYQETTLNDNSVVFVKPSQVRAINGEVVVFDPSGKSRQGVPAGVIVSTDRGTQSANIDADGAFRLPIGSSGKIPLVFRGGGISPQVVVANVSSDGITQIPTISLREKNLGEARFYLLARDFPGVLRPQLVADFNNFNPVPMVDDGTKGDEIPGDGVYTVVARNLTSGAHLYQISPFSELQRDPYEESFASGQSVVFVR